MLSNIDFDIDEILTAPLSPGAFDTLIDDPAFQHIYDCLLDASDAISHPFIDDVLQSTTVNPVWMPSIGSAISQVDIPYDNSKSGKIQTLSNPRMRFRPRTEKENERSSHYIRCEENMPSEYPTIHIPPEWNQQNNVIEVTLVDIQKNPHPYTLDNKECKEGKVGPKCEECRSCTNGNDCEKPILVYKGKQQNSLYFHVTEQDFKHRQKTFLIVHIKPKQDGIITKEAIKALQLEQSMLRFTRYYQTSDGTYHPDLSSVEYSSIMIEDYGSFSIEDVFPLYGPMCGDQKVCVELKGFLPKDIKTDLIINIIHHEANWFHQIQSEKIKKNGSTFTFLMPPYPDLLMDQAEVMIIIQYKQDIMYQSNYIYSRKIDEELTGGNSNGSRVTTALTNFSNDRAGASSMYSHITTEDEARGVKRGRQ